MTHIALLRGINVGGNHKVDMKKLKALFESLGYTQVSTYINSGNVVFESTDKADHIRAVLEVAFKKEFGFAIPTLVLSQRAVQKIVAAIPPSWANDTEQKTDVAFLFPDIDTKGILAQLPIKTEHADVRYVKGVLMWNIKKVDLNKSQLDKLVGHRVYKHMTVRNVNTARYLSTYII